MADELQMTEHPNPAVVDHGASLVHVAAAAVVVDERLELGGCRRGQPRIGRQLVALLDGERGGQTVRIEIRCGDDLHLRSLPPTGRPGPANSRWKLR